MAPFSFGDFVQGPIQVEIGNVGVPADRCIDFVTEVSEMQPLLPDRKLRFPFPVSVAVVVLPHASKTGRRSFAFLWSGAFNVCPPLAASYVINDGYREAAFVRDHSLALALAQGLKDISNVVFV
jgi:hypothetical protein